MNNFIHVNVQDICQIECQKNMPIECQLVFWVTRRQSFCFSLFFHVSKGFPEYFSVPFGVYHEQKRNFMGLWWDIGVEINVGIIWETVQGLFSKAVELFSTWHKDTMDGCEMRHQLIGAGLPIIVSGFQASKVVQDFFQRYCNCLLPPLGSSPGMLQDISQLKLWWGVCRCKWDFWWVL